MDAMILNIKDALEMLGGEKELYKELLQSFTENKKFNINELLKLEESDDTTEAAKYVHYFKGAARQLGGEKLGQSGQTLEDVLRKKSSGNISELNKTFFEDYKILVEEINKTLRIL
jgi:HPt (histidine-containing phosphotransfer) domain-containing protein